MNGWSQLAVASLESSQPSLVETLRQRLGTLSRWSRDMFPQMVHSLPVLYPFSGADLLTAHAMFPNAPSYTLIADFPTGDPSCFLDAACAAKANASATAFFSHWSNLRFARQSTNLMRRAFATSGQLPALLLSLRLIGLPVVYVTMHTYERQADGGGGGAAAASRPSSNKIQIPSITLYTTKGKVTFHSLLLRSDPSEHIKLNKQDWPNLARWGRGNAFIDSQLALVSEAIGADLTGQRQLYVTMFKAAPHWILRNAWMASWVLKVSAATLHDETGLRPRYYNNSLGATMHGWVSVASGAFREFENREVKWYPGEKAELQRLFSGPELPFQFGYAQSGGHGVLLAAWRRETA